MQEKLLSRVDPRRFMDTSGWNFNKSWSGKLDISVWIRANISVRSRLYLVLELQDQRSKRTISVDRCMAPSSESILLNARLGLAGRGPLDLFNFKLKFDGCEGSSIVLEEFSVKALTAKTIAGKIRKAV